MNPNLKAVYAISPIKAPPMTLKRADIETNFEANQEVVQNLKSLRTLILEYR